MIRRLLTLTTLAALLVCASAPVAHADDDGVSRRQLKKAFKEHRAELDKCGVHLEFETTIRIKFKVRRDGRTKSFRVESGGLSGSPVAECVEAVVRDMRFSRLKKSDSIRHKVTIPAANPLDVQEAAEAAPPPDAELPHPSYSELIGAIEARKDEIRGCEEVLAPDAPDRVVVRALFTVDMRGVPDNVRILDKDRRREAVGGCVAKTVRKMRFPAERKVTDIMYPFVVER